MQISLQVHSGSVVVLSVIRLGLKSFRVLEIICHYGTIITKHSSGSKSAQRGDGSNRDG